MSQRGEAMQAFLLLSVLMFCDEPVVEFPTKTTAPSVEVSVDGKRYIGKYLFVQKDEHVIYCTAVVLRPWSAQFDAIPQWRQQSGKPLNRRCEVKVGEFTVSLPGGPLVIAESPTNVSVVAWQIPALLEECASRRALEKRI